MLKYLVGSRMSESKDYRNSLPNMTENQVSLTYIAVFKGKYEELSAEPEYNKDDNIYVVVCHKDTMKHRY